MNYCMFIIFKLSGVICKSQLTLGWQLFAFFLLTIIVICTLYLVSTVLCQLFKMVCLHLLSLWHRAKWSGSLKFCKPLTIIWGCLKHWRQSGCPYKMVLDGFWIKPKSKAVWQDGFPKHIDHSQLAGCITGHKSHPPVVSYRTWVKLKSNTPLIHFF